MNVVTRRKATAGDAEFAFEAKRAGLRQHVEQLREWCDDEQRHRHHAVFADEDFEVVEWDGVEVGVLAVDRGPATFEVNHLYLTEGRTGEGIGTAIMTELLREAKGRGVSVHLQVLKPNARAMRFYQRLGFVETGRTEAHVLMQKQR